MKKALTIALVGLSIPAVSQAVEFQTPGAVGMGGAGVARNNGALTSYWNPAGGAFGSSSVAINAGAGAGVRGSDGLAENVDKLSKINFGSVKNFSSTSSNADNVGDVVKALTILKDIDDRKGNLAVAVVAPVSFSSGNFSFGIYGNMEGYIQPSVDITNILPNQTTGGAVTGALTVQNLSTAVGATTYPTSGYFSTAQLAALETQIIATSLTSPGGALTPAQASTLALAIENKLQSSGIQATTAYDAMTTKVLPTLDPTKKAATETINKNTTSAMTKAIQYIEVPLSYGYPINVGSNGKLGIGVTGKLISGTVYQNQILLVNRAGGDIKSKDLVNDITNNKKSSLTYGIDVGALYKYNSALSFGIVAKNLNSPKFDGPDYLAPVANDPASTVSVAGTAVELKPQVRSGVAFDPIGWLSVAADLDLTENETVTPGAVVGSSFKSRNFGGGFEAKPASWLKVRGGAYRNLASSRGNVLTAGLKLFLLDVDGAFATDSFVVNGTTLPQEVQLHASIGFSF